MSLQLARPIAAEVLGESPWVQAHEGVLGVARERAGLERREGVCLLHALRQDVHRHLGYGAFAEYTDRHLGYCHRTTADKLRTAEALERLPELARAQSDGRLNASAVRELARVATADTEADWIGAATGQRVRDVERLVSGRLRGDRPTDTPRPGLTKHILRFEVGAETLAAFREAMRHVAERTGQRLDDDAALLLIARGTLELPSPSVQQVDRAVDSAGPEVPEVPDAGRARYQISIIECPSCQRAFTPAGADLLEIEPAALAAARCDAQTIVPSDASERGTTASHEGAANAPTGVRSRSANDATHVDDADATHGRDADAPHAQACSTATHGGDTTGETHGRAASLAASTRTTQSIPTRVRRHVLARDHRTCQIPGCRNTLDIELHHIQPRAEGGTNHADNLPCICSIHHRAIHRGQLHVSGTAGALVVQHADGTPYGGPVSATHSDTSEKVFRGLRWLGYKERDARAAIQSAFRELDAEARSALLQNDEALLRRALAQLR